MSDADGKPGGLAADPCQHNPQTPNVDDTLSDVSNWGAAVDITAPGCATSTAQPKVAGAAAILASISHPDDRADVEAIRKTLLAIGNHDWVDTGGLKGDGKDCKDPGGKEVACHEPLIDLSCEKVFAPVMVAGTQSPSGPAPLKPPAADVNCDGRSDLVTLRPDGTVQVRPGKAGGTFGAPTVSFSNGAGAGTLNPAQYDGAGHYAIDVADVDANGYADLITLTDDGKAHVYPGDPDRTFDARGKDQAGTTTNLALTPGLLAPGGHEPIAVADVTGEGRADLISYDDVGDKVMVYPGEANRAFGAGVLARSAVSSALHTGSGEYFLDAADVTGDGKADLVSMTTTNNLRVYPGKAGGTFDAPFDSHKGEITPSSGDGVGYEPRWPRRRHRRRQGRPGPDAGQRRPPLPRQSRRRLRRPRHLL